MFTNRQNKLLHCVCVFKSEIKGYRGAKMCIKFAQKKCKLAIEYGVFGALVLMFVLSKLCLFLIIACVQLHIDSNRHFKKKYAHFVKLFLIAENLL